MISTRSTISFFLLTLLSLAISISAVPVPPTVTTTPAISNDCWYVGTFFKLINCNAKADSTSIPYARVASSAVTKLSAKGV